MGSLPGSESLTSATHVNILNSRNRARPRNSPQNNNHKRMADDLDDEPGKNVAQDFNSQAENLMPAGIDVQECKTFKEQKFETKYCNNSVKSNKSDPILECHQDEKFPKKSL